MAETDCRSSHVVIDVEAEGDHQEACICVVCMEPMEWVAVSPCGHREVCVRCAASIRFFHNDLRCCICRSHCSTVVVTKVNRASTQRGFPFLWPPPPAFASEVLVGHYYWYHRGMGAYFDDLYQYQEMKKVCSTSTTTTSRSSEEAAGAPVVVNYVGYPDHALLPPQPAASVNVNLNALSVSPRQAAEAPLEEPSSSDVGTSLFCIAVGLPLLATGGFLMVAKHPYPKVLIVVLVSVLLSAFTACTIYAWRKFSNNSLQWGWMN